MRYLTSFFTLLALIIRPVWSNEIPCVRVDPPLDVSSFGPLQETFQCDVFQQRRMTDRRIDIRSNAGALTPFWAQEMVGADLAQDYLAQNAERTQNVATGIIDEGFAPTTLRRDRMGGAALACRDAVRECNPHAGDLILAGHTLEEIDELLPETDTVCPTMERSCPEGITKVPQHGNSTSHLIIGDPPVGVAPNAQLTWTDHIFHRRATPTERRNRIRLSMRSTSPRPQVVNASVGCTNSHTDSCRAFIRDLQVVDEEAILVKSSGNNYPMPTDESTNPQIDFSGISVGSLSPTGLMSEFSSEGPEVTISAPSDEYITSRQMSHLRQARRGSTEIAFGGTSGAAPLVTGAVTNVLSFLPWANGDDVKELLRRTAIDTAGFRPNNGQNGAGALNTFKLTRIASRIANSGLPEEEARALIFQDGTYDFSQRAATLKQEAVELMAEIPYNARMCDRHKLALRKMRVAYFLNPDDSSLREGLAEIYRANGYNAQANYVDPDATPQEVIPQITSALERMNQLLRSRTFTMDDWPELQRLITGRIILDEDKAEIFTKVMGLSRSMSTQVISRMLSTFSGPDSMGMLSIFSKFARGNPENYLQALTLATRSPTISNSQKATILTMAMQNSPRNSARELFETALRSKVPEMRTAAAVRVTDAFDRISCESLLDQYIAVERDEVIRGSMENDRARCALIEE